MHSTLLGYSCITSYPCSSANLFMHKTEQKRLDLTEQQREKAGHLLELFSVF